MKRTKGEQAERLKALLAELKVSRRGAARILELDERTIYRYCAGRSPIPATVFMALESLKKISEAQWPHGTKAKRKKALRKNRTI